MRDDILHKPLEFGTTEASECLCPREASIDASSASIGGSVRARNGPLGPESRFCSAMKILTLCMKLIAVGDALKICESLFALLHCFHDSFSLRGKNKFNGTWVGAVLFLKPGRVTTLAAHIYARPRNEKWGVFRELPFCGCEKKGAATVVRSHAKAFEPPPPMYLSCKDLDLLVAERPILFCRFHRVTAGAHSSEIGTTPEQLVVAAMRFYVIDLRGYYWPTLVDLVRIDAQWVL